MGRNPGHTAGEGAELSVAGHLIEAHDCRISVPHGESHKYDLIADYEDELFKIQVKKARQVRPEKYQIGTEDYTENEVDLFAGYVSERDEVFYVSFDEAEEHGDSFAVTYAGLDDEGFYEYHREMATLAENHTFEHAISNDDDK